jgi:hypothetical protein
VPKALRKPAENPPEALEFNVGDDVIYWLDGSWWRGRVAATDRFNDPPYVVRQLLSNGHLQSTPHGVRVGNIKLPSEEEKEATEVESPQNVTLVEEEVVNVLERTIERVLEITEEVPSPAHEM